MSLLPNAHGWNSDDEERLQQRREEFYKRIQYDRKTPAPERDVTGKWVMPPKPKTKSAPVTYTEVAEEPLKDWRVLLRDLTARSIVVVDMHTGATDTYYRRQKSGEDELLWYSKKDMLEPEGHTVDRMQEMWDRGWVFTRYVSGFEPPHTCVGKTAGGCPPCIEQAKVLAGEKNKK